ncbi:MAG TPA: hypothetical protein VF407_06000, partial [Polyangiaceae bacterium]
MIDVRSRPTAISAGVVGVAMLGLGCLRLFAGPGYEHALATGLIAPSAAAITTALENSRVAKDDDPHRPIMCILHGIEIGLFLAAISLFTALLHGLRVGFCDFTGGVLGFALTALPGTILGGIWGAVAGEIAGRTKRRKLVSVLVSLAGPLACVFLGLARFYTSPMVFAFDPFVGYFSGSFYDTVVDPGSPLLSYRFGTLATIAFALAAASLVERDGDHFVWAPTTSTTLARRILCVTAFLTSLYVTADGKELGHWQTTDSIAADLGGRKSGTRCDVVYPQSMSERDASLLVKDCDEEIAGDEKVLGIHGPDRITAFFFRDAGDKKRLMGAGDVYIAKPWRKEVYLQVGGYPHPVLGHEIAHVVAGAFGRGPFKIAGALGGLWPNPGLIEGVAVATAPEEGELTELTWARAMLDLGILPPMREIVGVDFLGRSSSQSYTTAGAFIKWMMKAYGVDKVRAVYGGTPFEVATGKSVDALDAEFRAFLKSDQPLPDQAMSFAKGKFDRPGLFSRLCPHVVDGLLEKANACRDGQSYAQAIGLYDEILAKDPVNAQATFNRATSEVRAGATDKGRADLEALEKNAAFARSWHDRSEEALADDELARGLYEQAAARYKALAAATLDEDAGRTYEVKLAGALDPIARPAITGILLGPQRGDDPFYAATLLGAWQTRTHDPLADYLIGKNTARKGQYDEALPHFEAVIDAGAPSTRIGRELLHQYAIIACAKGDPKLVARAKTLME